MVILSLLHLLLKVISEGLIKLLQRLLESSFLLCSKLIWMFHFQAWVYGNSFESFLVAVVNPNKHALESWAQEHEVAGDFSSLCQHPRAKAYILEKLNKIARENKVSSYVFSFLNFYCFF